MNNIIECKLESTHKEIFTGLWQHDYGQILRITGADLPKAVEVQFSTKDKGGDTLTRIGTTVDGATEVKVPDSLLKNENCTQNYLIYAWIYVTDDTSGNTEYQIILHVKSRPKPEEPTEEPLPEPNIFHETVEAVNAAADRAKMAEQSAKESATEAGKYAASASESAVTAEKTKEDALRKVGEKKQEAIEAIQNQEETSAGKITTHTDGEIQRIQNQTTESKGELEQTIINAGVSEKELEHSIETAGTSKTALDKSVELAGTAKTELDTSIREAGTAKTALDESTETAGTVQETLSATVKQAGALDTSLGENIETGTQLKTGLVASGEKAVQDIQAAGSEQLGKMQAVAEAFTADREQIANNKEDIGSLKEGIVCLSSKTASNETKACDVTDLFTLNGFLNKKGEFVDNAASLCTDYIDAKKGEVYYLYISQDDTNTLPIAVYNTDKGFVKGVENKGNTYQLQYFEYTVEEDCLIRISSMNVDSSLIYRKEFKNNSEVFDEINTKIGQLETYYEDKTQYVLEHKTDNKYLNGDGVEGSYSGGLVSDYIEVDEGDSIKAGSYVLYHNPVLLMYYSNKKLYKSFATVDNGFNTVTTVIPPMVKYIRISSLDQSKEINFQILRHKSIIDYIKEFSKEKNYVIPNTYDELALTNTTSGYINDGGTIQPTDSYVTSDYIDLDNYDYFRLVSDYAWNACGYVTFDDNRKVLSYVKDSKNTLKRLDIVPQDIFPTAKYIRFCGGTNNLHVYIKKQTTLITNGLEEALETGNVLYHKKIAFCGDSFTEAVNLGKTLYDNFIGCYKSFGWRIANRNKMKLYHDGISSSTMHIVNKENPNDRSPFVYERYKNVPVDCDYIILQFGLNESNIADSDTTKGTKDSTDTTTMWGAWNTVLGYLIENHPTARIGIIMSDAWMPQSYYITLKEICEWWGIPLLDLGGDPNVPVMNGGRRAGSGLVLNPKVAELRNATFYNADGDAHPNDKGHEWRSTVIENWIRSL